MPGSNTCLTGESHFDGWLLLAGHAEAIAVAGKVAAGSHQLPEKCREVGKFSSSCRVVSGQIFNGGD